LLIGRDSNPIGLGLKFALSYRKREAFAFPVLTGKLFIVCMNYTPFSLYSDAGGL